MRCGVLRVYCGVFVMLCRGELLCDVMWCAVLCGVVLCLALCVVVYCSVLQCVLYCIVVTHRVVGWRGVACRVVVGLLGWFVV